ncbi:MAG: restriction endonuclease subunit S [Firmicutes bacterium]|nr:restriction endonuclease subunit S [Bacillota bacterium]
MGFPFVKEGINFIKIENITTDNKIILDKVDCISNECNDKLKRSQLQIGDILFSIAGAIGRCAIVGESALPANTNQALAIIRLKKDTQVDKNYLIKVLQSDKIIGQYTKMKQGVAQLNLSLANIGDFEIDLPSPSVQQCIAAELDAVCEVKSSLKMEIEKTETLYKALMQKYFDPKMMMEVL